MKKTFFLKAILTSFLITFLVVPAVMAYTIQIADDYGIFSTYWGGEFTVTPINDASTWNPRLNTYNSTTKDVGGNFGSFQTFCLEYGVELNHSRTYTVFFNSQTDPNGDPISRGTAWLYHEFQQGKLEGYNYDTTNGHRSHRLASAYELQEAIWWLEDEIWLREDEIADNDFIALVKSLFDNPKGDNNEEYPVSVLNLYNWRGRDAQDLLVCDPVHTPEPATMVLLGSGLLGLAGLARKKFHKQQS